MLLQAFSFLCSVPSYQVCALQHRFIDDSHGQGILFIDDLSSCAISSVCKGGISFFFGNFVLFFIFGAAAAPVAVLAEPKGKQKKKGKKSGRTIQEEEDLDAILAELEGPIRSVPPAAEAVVPASVSPAPVALEESAAAEKSLAAGAVLPDTEEVTESAASKKKKKKKEKEKAAKAGAGTLGELKCFYAGVLLGARSKWL